MWVETLVASPAPLPPADTNMAWPGPHGFLEPSPVKTSVPGKDSGNFAERSTFHSEGIDHGVARGRKQVLQWCV